MMCFMLSEKTVNPRAGDKRKLKKKTKVSFRLCYTQKMLQRYKNSELFSDGLTLRERIEGI